MCTQSPNWTANVFSAASAIGNLGAPITTTNYDSLLEKGLLSRSATTWMDLSESQLVLQRRSSRILHLHGYWEQPDSVILGTQSYGMLAEHATATHVEKVLATAQSLLFIGCGDGLADPNFESLRRWLSTMFHDAEARHYRLCLDSELPRLASLHRDERIIPVAYGASHDQLLPFLDSLQPESGSHAVPSPTPTTSTSIPRQAAEAISSQIRSTTVLAETMADVDGRMPKEILIPPVLLPTKAMQPARRSPKFIATRCSLGRDVRAHFSSAMAGYRSIRIG